MNSTKISNTTPVLDTTFEFKMLKIKERTCSGFFLLPLFHPCPIQIFRKVNCSKKRGANMTDPHP